MTDAILLGVVTAYGIVGIAVTGAFFAIGVTTVLPQASMTIGARLLVLPGVVALWPVILCRWLKASTIR